MNEETEPTCLVCDVKLEQRGNWFICPSFNCPWHDMIQVVAHAKREDGVST